MVRQGRGGRAKRRCAAVCSSVARLGMVPFGSLRFGAQCLAMARYGVVRHLLTGAEKEKESGVN